MTMTVIIEVLLALIAVGEPVIFYSIYRKIKKAQLTDANSSNSIKLIEIQDKYINLIEDKDSKIRELQDERNALSSELIYYKTTHCEIMSCTNRRPPLKETFIKEGVQ